MAKKPQSDWEKAARALCSFDGVPENIVRDGKPMWTQYLAEAKAVAIIPLKQVALFVRLVQ